MTQSPPPTPPATPDAAVPPPPPPRRKRRWVLKTLVALVLLVLLGVALLPTLLSLSPARSLLLGQAQSFVPHGKLQASGLSFGWFSPIRLTGFKLLDEQGKPVIEADEIKTDLTLVQAIRQKFDLSGTVIDAAAHLVVFADGHTNLQHVLGLDEPPAAKPRPAATRPSTPSKPSTTTLPDVKGDLTLKLHGDVTLVDAAESPVATLRLRPGSGGTVNIPDINQTITADLQFVYDTGDGTRPGTVGLKSTVDAIEHNRLDLPGLAATLDLPVKDVDLAAFQPFLAVKYPGVRVAGVAGGDIAGELKPGQSGGIHGSIDVAGVELAAPQLKDTYRAAAVSIPVSVTRSVTAGVSRLQLDTGVVLPEASAKVVGDVPEADVYRIAARDMPADTGAVTVTLTADLQKLTAALPNTVKLLPGVSVDQGSFVSGVTVTLKPDFVQAHVKTDLSLKGQQDGKPIAVEPITFTSDARLTQLKSPSDLNGLRDLAVSFSSAFANFQASGPTLASLQGKGDADLSRAQQQAGQFVDLKGLRLAGQAKFDLSSRVPETDALVREAALNATVSGLKVVRPQQPNVELATASVGATAVLAVDRDGLKIMLVRNATATLAAAQTADKPLVNAKLAMADFDLQNRSLGSVAVQSCDVPSLARLQQFIDPLVPALAASGITVTDGSLAFAAEANAIVLAAKKGNLTRCDLSLPKLAISRNGQELVNDTVRMSVAGTATPQGKMTVIDLSKLSGDSAIATLAKADGPLTVQLQGGLPRGTGALNVSVDAVRANRIARLLSPPAPAPVATADAPAAAPPASVPQVTSGKFAGTLALANPDGHDATVGFDGALTGLTLAGTPVKNETYTVALKAAVSAAFDHVTAGLSVKGDALSVVGSNIAAKMPGPGVPAFKALETATLDVGVRDLAKAQTVLSAFGVRLPVRAGGGLATKITAAAGTFTVDGGVSRLTVANDKGRSFDFDPKKPVAFKLTAAVEGDTAIDAVKVSELSVDADVVKITQAEPIVVSGLGKPGGTMTARGKLVVAGTFDRLLPLLAVVQSADTPMPYRGAFNFTEAVVPEGGSISLKGGGTIDDFAALDADGKPQFSEKQVQLKNDLKADPATHAATINALTLDMASSKAATLSMSGGVDDWITQRRLKNVVIHVDAVGEKIWPIVYGLMPPAQETQFKDAKLTGPIVVDFTAGGSYPAKPTWNESLRTVLAYGSVSMKSLSTMGLEISDFALPLTISDNGQLVTGDLRKKKAERFAKPFTVNGGKGDFGSIVLQLGDPDLKLSIGRGQKLLQGVQINPVLASQVGSLASVLFSDSENASGQLDLTVTECNDVLLKELMDKKATASFVYGIKDLRLDGRVPAALSQVLKWGDSGINGNIDGATLALKGGVAQQDMTLALEHENTDAKSDAKSDGKSSAKSTDGSAGDAATPKTKTETMKFQGGVNLANNTFKNYHLTLSPGLLWKDLRKNLPDGATVELKGKVTDMAGVLAQAIGQLAVEGYGKDALDKALGGKEGKDGKEGGLGGLLDKLNKKKSK